jgi:hypothetical protein
MAIWRLFEEGHFDANMATVGLLAVDLGARRGRELGEPSPRRAGEAPERGRPGPRGQP